MKASSFTIRTRLTLAFGLLLGVLSMLAVTSLYSINTTGADLNDIYQNQLLPLNQMQRINDLMRQTTHDLTIATISRGSTEDLQEYLARVQVNLNQIENLTRIYMDGNLTDEERLLAGEWVENKDTLIDKAIRPTIADLVSGNFTDAQDLITGVGGQLYKKDQAVMDQLIGAQLQTAEHINIDAQQNVFLMHAVTTCVIAIVFLFFIIVALLIRSITRPIARLVSDVDLLAKGEADRAINGLDRHDEIGFLAGALENWRQSIIEVHKTRDEARERARQMEILNASIRTLLDSLGEGILSFEANSICSDVYSKSCFTFFETSPGNRPVTEILAITKEDKPKFENILKLVFGGIKTMATSPQELLDMLPKHFPHSKGLSVSLQYRPVLDNAGTLHSVLVVATDRTEQETAMRLVREREASALMVLRMSAHSNDFRHFYHGITEFFASSDVSFGVDISLEQIKRDIHTFKGMASLYYLQDLSNALHELEAILESATDIRSVEDAFKVGIISVNSAIINAREAAIKVLGSDFDKQGMTRILPLHLLKELSAEIKKIPQCKDLSKRFDVELIGEPIHKLLFDFDLVLQELANRYGKKMAPCKVIGENFTVFTETYMSLFATFVHIFRNIIDHGIDGTNARKQYGKPSECTVTFESQRFDRNGADWFSLSFMDDGAGIEVQRLRNKLLSRGIDVSRMNDEMVLQQIFNDGISTKAGITELSGRGVGMSAIKYEIERLGGRVYVESKFHHFTKITLELPFIWS